MRINIIISSVVLATVFLTALAWKWGVKIRFGVVGGIAIGIVTGIITSGIESAYSNINMMVLLAIEFIVVLTITLITIVARFFRDPERHPAETENVILAPADGKVIYVNRVESASSLVSTKGGRKFKLDEIMNTKLLSEGAYLIGIDMNVLNVHVNRSPIAGKTVFLKRTSGKFISLRKPESETVNERVTTIIANETLRVGVVQIASRLVRRIVSYVGEGDNLVIGQRIGAIVFGSQVDVIIPKLETLNIEIAPKDEVTAGVSVIARYRTQENKRAKI